MAPGFLSDPEARRAYLLTKAGVVAMALLLTWPLSRWLGNRAWLAFGERGLRSQLREAGKRSMRYTVILGEDELATGTATVRDMQAGEQTSVELAGLVEWLKLAVSG